jgi:hypothetical protein
MAGARAVNKHLAERFHWLSAEIRYGMTSEAVGTLPRRPTEDRRLSVGVIG